MDVEFDNPFEGEYPQDEPEDPEVEPEDDDETLARRGVRRAPEPQDVHQPWPNVSGRKDLRFQRRP